MVIKGFIQYINGILRARFSSKKARDIFEVGVPKQKKNVDEGAGFSENGYSFCEKIEDVSHNMVVISSTSNV